MRAHVNILGEQANISNPTVMRGKGVPALKEVAVGHADEQVPNFEPCSAGLPCAVGCDPYCAMLSWAQDVGVHHGL